MATIKSKIALVTGGSRGLGKNMSISLAKKGIDVILTYNSNRQKADEVVTEIESLGQKALPFINNGGRIINISSGLARFSFPGSSVYGSMKGAIEVLTRYLAKELGPRGIAANVVVPGAIETDFGGGRIRDNKEVNDQVASVTALGRAGLPDDIGGVVAFLCTEDARWINGQRIEVSGGMML